MLYSSKSNIPYPQNSNTDFQLSFNIHFQLLLYLLSSSMAASRSPMWVKSMVRLGAPTSTFTTLTFPKLNLQTLSAHHLKSKQKVKGEWVPVYVAVGLILMSAGLGVHTAMHLLGRSPGVYVKKSRRETIPEVEDPDETLEYANRFMNKSFFRKVAHVQDYDLPMPHPIPDDDVYARRPRAETLKSVGVDPKPKTN